MIDPAAIDTIRTSVRRLLAERGAGPLPFAMPQQLIAGWNAARKICGEDFALQIASELPVGSFGRTSYAFASAPNVREALGVFCRDVQRAIDGARAELVADGETMYLTLSGPETLGPIFELLTAIIALRCRQLVDPPLEVTAVGLPVTQPERPELWTKFFGVLPQFGLDHARLALPAIRLGLPLRTTDPTVRDALGTAPIASTSDAVRAHVRQWIRESPSANEVARALGLSTRSLQRRLGEEGTTFRELVIGVRIDLAKQLLERGDLTIAEIADAVGFASVSVFSKACSQSLGMSPSTYRAEHGARR